MTWPIRCSRTYGTVVKVSFHLHNDYDLHVKFSGIISDEVFQKFPCGRANGR